MSRRNLCNPKPFKAKPQGYVFGRPTLYKPEYCDLVVSLMGNGYDLSAFAGSIRVSRDAVYDWVARWPDFRHAVEIGKAARLYALQHKLLNTQIGVGVTAAIFALKNADPENWQDRYNTTTEVNVRIEHVSDEQLLAIAAQRAPTLAIEHDDRPEAQRVDQR